MRNVKMFLAMLALLISMLSVVVEGTMYGETSISGALSHDFLSASNCSETSCYNGVPNTPLTSYGGHDQLIMSKSFRDRAIPVAYEVISDVNDDGLKSVIGARLTRGPRGRGEVIRYGRSACPIQTAAKRKSIHSTLAAYTGRLHRRGSQRTRSPWTLLE
ncbi:hypothetical protein LTR17_005244 [Elasticomyces elasticus]|nr:hypothetical protein LTR17_005244 [Elasticomyces elasticus]